MKASKMAVVRLPFEKVVSINQIGDDISANKPMFILVTGKIKGQEGLKTKIITVGYCLIRLSD